MKNKVVLPRYFVLSVLRHYEAITERCKPPRDDNKAINAQRLAKGEIRRLKKIIQQQSNED